MAITLHWWVIPIAIMLMAVAIAWRHEDRYGYMPDFTRPFVIFMGCVIAIALCVGHWL